MTMPALPQADEELAAWPRAHVKRLAHAAQARRRAWAVALLFAVAVGLGLCWIEASPGRIWNGLSRLGYLVTLMLPPSSGGALGELCYALVETLAMAFLGTLLAAIAAVPLGFL